MFKYIITGKCLQKCFELGQWSPNHTRPPHLTSLWLTSFLTKDANILHPCFKSRPQCAYHTCYSPTAHDFSLELLSFPKEMNNLKNRWEKTGQKFYDVFVLLYALDLQLMNSWGVIYCSYSGWMVLLEKRTDELKHLTLIMPQFQVLLENAYQF